MSQRLHGRVPISFAGFVFVAVALWQRLHCRIRLWYGRQNLSARRTETHRGVGDR